MIVKLPDAEAVGEAFLVGCIIKNGPPSIVYTLEQGFSRVTLAGWTKRAHVNFGEGLKPTIEAFREAIIKKQK